MHTLLIECPWCRVETPHDVDTRHIVSSDLLQKQTDQEGYLLKVENAPWAFKCQNPACWAPCEGILCDNKQTAEQVRRLVSHAAWSSPRCVAARMSEATFYSLVTGVVYNRLPLNRWREIRLSELVRPDVIAKFLAFFSRDFKTPVTLFEAWATRGTLSKPGKVFWLPVQPAGAKRVGVAREARTVCETCRNVFESKAIGIFYQERTENRPCLYKSECPNQEKCPVGRDDEEEESHVLSGCLRFLEILEENSPCYSSDLDIIQGTVERFQNGDLTENVPVKLPCWLGYEEWVYPVVVHEHLIGVVITGQFDTDKSPTSIEDFLHRETCWRERHSPPMSQQIVLDQDKARNSLLTTLSKGKPKGQLNSDAQKALEKDIEQLAEIATERYLQKHHLTENAFRQYLTGTAARFLFKGDDLGVFLPEVLTRMRVFWAFQDAALCVMADSEAHLRLIAVSCFRPSDNEFQVPPHQSPPRTTGDENDGETAVQDFFFGKVLTTTGLDSLTSERGAFDILLKNRKWLRDRESLPAPRNWLTLKDELKNYLSATPQAVDNLSFFVTVRVGPRSYVFCFFGRNVDQLSNLPRYPSDRLSLSREVREQIITSCEHLTGYLHQFWSRNDQEHMYRVISHSLRSLVATMRKGAGLIRYSLNKCPPTSQREYQNLYNDAQTLCESISQGSKAVDDELTSLASIAKLDEYSKKPGKDTTDLAELVRTLESLYRWRSRSASLRVEGVFVGATNKWSFSIPDKASVQGNKDNIMLAVRNVLDNAFKYSYAGRDIDVRVVADSGKVTLVVTNSGVPVQDDEQDKVWQRDYRGFHVRRRDAKAEAGTGYGLFIVKRIMDTIGGSAFLQCQLLPPRLAHRPEGRTTVMLTFLPAQ